MKSVKNSTPNPDYISDDCATYYLVKVKNYGFQMAMYLEDDLGNKNWYTNYFSKIIKPVTRWMRTENI